MPQLSGGDVTALRADGHRVRRYLAVAPQYTVATARINQAIFPQPLAEVVIDTVSVRWSDVVAGMTVRIGTTAGASDMGTFRVRKAPTTTALYLMELSTGDPGLTSQASVVPLNDNAYVTVLLDFNLWSVFSRINYSGDINQRTGLTFKDFDIGYTDQTEDTPPIAVNIGQHRAVFLDDGDTDINVAFVASIVAFDSATASTYSWDVFHADDADFAVSTASNPTLTLEEGFHVVRCTVTANTGAVGVAVRGVWVFGDNYQPLDITITSDRRTIQGRRMSFNTRSPLSGLGAMALYFERASWGNAVIDDAVTQMAGWIQEYSGRHAPNDKSQQFELISPMGVMAILKAFGQQLTIVPTPTTWQEVIVSLARLDFWVYYLLNYHSTYTQLFDFLPSNLAGYFSQAWKVDTGDLARQLANVGARLNISSGCLSDGAFALRLIPTMWGLAIRNQSPNVMTLTDDDITNLDVRSRVRPAFGKCVASGFTFDGVALRVVLAAAPGFVGGQGSGETRLENQLVITQTELNERASHHLARENNPIPSVTVRLAGNYDVFEPALGEWVTLDLSADAWVGGSAFTSRCLIESVSIQHSPDGRKIVTLELTPETIGDSAAAQTVPVILPDGGTNSGIQFGNTFTPFPTVTPLGLLSFDYDPFTPSDWTAPPEPLPDVPDDGTFAIAWGDDKVFVTPRALLPTPIWYLLFDEGEPVQSVVTSGTPAALAMWILTDVALWYSANALGETPNFTKLEDII